MDLHVLVSKFLEDFVLIFKYWQELMLPNVIFRNFELEQLLSIQDSSNCFPTA